MYVPEIKDRMYTLAADLLDTNTEVRTEDEEYHRALVEMIMMSEGLGSDHIEDIAAALSKYTDPDLTAEQKRLESLRVLVRAEYTSWAEVSELQGLAEHINPSDVELLEASGVPEHAE